MRGTENLIKMTITVDDRFFTPYSGERLVGTVCAAFHDSEGELWFAFELPDMGGVHVIAAASENLLGVDVDD